MEGRLQGRNGDDVQRKDGEKPHCYATCGTAPKEGQGTEVKVMQEAEVKVPQSAAVKAVQGKTRQEAEGCRRHEDGFQDPSPLQGSGYVQEDGRHWWRANVKPNKSHVFV